MPDLAPPCIPERIQNYRTRHNAADFAPRDFDAAIGVEDGLDFQTVQRAQAYQDWPCASQTHARAPTWQRVRVVPAGAQMRLGSCEPTIVYGPEARLVDRLQQVAGRESRFGEF